MDTGDSRLCLLVVEGVSTIARCMGNCGSRLASPAMK
jgi:hypothetical protein